MEAETCCGGLRTGLKRMYEALGLPRTPVCSARDALRVVANTDPDLVILDILMPDVDGWETCRRLRAISDVPILMFTVLGGSANAAKGLRLGADDYLEKGGDVAELRARVEVLLRRSKSSASREPRVHVVDDELSVDFEKRAAIVRGRIVELTLTELRLLACLAERPGRVWVNFRPNDATDFHLTRAGTPPPYPAPGRRGIEQGGIS